MAPGTQKCSGGCKRELPLNSSHFGTKSNGTGFYKQCLKCAARDTKRGKKKGLNSAPAHFQGDGIATGTYGDEDESMEAVADLPEVSFRQFIQTLEAEAGVHSVATFVNTSEIENYSDMQALSNQLAHSIWKATGFCWV